MIDDSLKQVIGRTTPNPGQRFVEGRVRTVTPEGLLFIVPTWDAGKHVFGPAPFGWGRTNVGVHEHPGADHDHLTYPSGTFSQADTEEAGAHTHDLRHEHHAPVPRPGDRCLVVLLGSGVDNPWVVGWWPA